MAQKLIIELSDDIDGSAATQTVTFALRGVEYEMDLNDENAAGLEEALAPFVTHARRVRSRKRSANRAGGTPDDIDPAAVRAWAAEQGMPIGPRGRIPYAIVDQYRSKA